MLSNLPPCLKGILNNKKLTEQYYYLIIRYINDNHRDKLAEALTLLADLGIQVDLKLSLYQRFSCADVPKELCSDECPIKQDKFENLKARTKEVLMVLRADDEDAYLLVNIEDKWIRVPLDPEKMCSEFVKGYAKNFGELLDIDRRRTKDREGWVGLINYWLSISRQIREDELLREQKTENEDMVIREIVENTLYSTSLTDNKETVFEGVTGFAYYDGVYAYYPRDLLLKAIINAGYKISPTKLSRLVRFFDIAEVVRLQNENIRCTFYRFKPTEAQIKAFEKKKKEGEINEVNSDIRDSRDWEDYLSSE